MKRLLLFLGWSCAVGSLSAQPKLAIDPMELELGILYNGAVKSGRYTITNIGNEPLQIKYVQPSCGCTAVRKPQEWIQPGHADIMEIQFNSTGMRGRVEKYVFVSTNDPTAKDITVKLVADVREELQSTSPINSILLGGVALGKEITQTMTLKNTTQKVIKLKNVSTTGKSVRAKADKIAINPADSVLITVTVVPEKEGFAYDYVVLQTDSNNQPRVEIRVSYIGVKEQ